jgi:alpha-L-fucosidase
MRYLLVAALAVVLARTSLSQSPEAAQQDRLKWWTEARFGMFIHWGIYTIPAGEWNGREIEGLGEWIMNRGKIPVRDYQKLAAQFNPVQFDADKWVAIAKNAGMKYITITSKHHDGFAMYGSKTSPYNIVDATPFHRDPMKDLAAACQRQGLKLCFYYSQTQDWHEPDAVGNDWDFPNESGKNFQKYYDAKVIPQVRELLTNYGPLALSGSTRLETSLSSRAGSSPISCTCCSRSAW